jgi:subtilisin family serine protease
MEGMVMTRFRLFGVISSLLLVFSAAPLYAQFPKAPAGYPRGPLVYSSVIQPNEGQLIVKLKRGAERRIRKELKRRKAAQSKHLVQKRLARKLGLRTSEKLAQADYVVKGRRLNSKKIVRAQRRYVKTVEPNYKVFTFDVPNDLFYLLGLTWSLDNMGIWGGKADIDIDAPEAWDIHTGNSDLVVGVIDTGIYLEHPDLKDNIWSNPQEIPNNNLDDDKNGYIDDVNGWDFANEDNDPTDDHYHGSHCSGIIAAVRNNGRGIAGVAPNVKLLGLKMMAADGSGDTANLIRAIEYATKLKKKGMNIRVLNASVGGGDYSEIMKEAISRANKAGILIVAAAGNSSEDNDAKPVYPASYDLPNVISVAALDSSGELASYSNFGANSVHVAAPGSFIWSSIVYGFYLPFSGTSMAAPHVSGVAALLMSKRPGLSPAQVRDKIMNSVKPLDNLRGSVSSPGIVSAYNVLK